jgi:7-carboxy-7-deazaguanine synthase
VTERPDTLVVSEVFGPTVQGEGPSLGRRAAFVRLGRCNLDCGAGPGATWACDTPYTWDWERFDPATELRVRAIDEIVATVAAMEVDRVVVTGGEPLLQQRRLLPFLELAAAHRWAVEIETNGTLAPTAETVRLVERLNVSPKLANSGVVRERAIVPAALASLVASGKAAFKFVAADLADLDEIQKLVEEHHLAPVWIMPAGTTPESVLAGGRLLADDVIARGWQITTRLHVLLWGDERGR